MKHLLASFSTALLLLLSPNLKAQSNSLWDVHIGTDSREVLFQKMVAGKAVGKVDSLQDRLRFSTRFEGLPAELTFDVAKASRFKSLGPDLVYAGYAAFDAKDWDSAKTAAFMYERYQFEKGPENRNCDNCKTDFTADSFAKESALGKNIYLVWKEPGGFVRELQYLPQTQTVTLGYHYVEIAAIINLFKDAPQIHPPLIFNR